MVSKESFLTTVRAVYLPGPDDGTVSPWVVVASLPFAPEIVVPTITNFARMNLGIMPLYGFKPSFNQTYRVEDNNTGWWVSPLLRHRPGARHFDDRKLPDGLAVGHHASMPADRDWIAQGGFCRGLAELRCSR